MLWAVLKVGPNLTENAEDSGKMVAPEFKPLAVLFSKLCAKVIHSTVRINHLHSGKSLAYLGQIEGGPEHSCFRFCIEGEEQVEHSL